MPPPSPLAIATSVVDRLVKEEESYHKELEHQKKRVEKLEKSNGDEYEIKQEKQAIEETLKVFPTLHDKVKNAVYKLEQQLEQDKEGAPENERTKAQTAIDKGWAMIRSTA